MQGAVEHKKGGLLRKTFSLILVILLNFIFTAQAQDSEPGGNFTFLSRYISRLINDTTDASRPRFLIYPTLAFSPETSWETGLSSLYVYHARRDTTNRMSEINGFTFFTLENQYGLWFDHANYTDRNNWFFLGRLRYQSFPLLYYGIGPDSPRTSWQGRCQSVSVSGANLEENIQKHLCKIPAGFSALKLGTVCPHFRRGASVAAGK